ncbi:sugar phosphate isomerase/epimerase family protein [Shivajiella indica]|uniref:Sugar phosphate isomerase/epimerase family protein n=1 Tax=Shivajiella indica TaxID=872115 RepID=A0ABW5B7A9_9BACT
MEEIKAYENTAKKADIIIAEVGAWSNPISPDPQVAKEAFEKCTASLRLADEIGANCCVNIAGSKSIENWAGPHPENFSEDTFDQIVEITRKIIDEIKPKRTYFTLEAMPWISPESPESYLRLIKAIDRKAFAVHLDPVNMVTSPAVFFRNGELIKVSFKKLGPFIKSCHAKDLILKQGTFMPQFDEVIPGRGQMNYKIFLQELSKYPEIPLMMEHLSSAEEYREGAEYIRNVLEKI